MLRALATLSPVSIMTCRASACLGPSRNRRPRTGNQPSHLDGPLVRQLPRCSASNAAALLLLTWSSNVKALHRGSSILTHQRFQVMPVKAGIPVIRSVDGTTG